MKTAVRTDILTTLQDFESNSFTIAVNDSTFRVLLDTLYTNKVRAVIRELWTNAFDSHVEAGTPALPFECQLPTRWDPTFRVRDYGVGLSHEDVMHLYTTVFSSTKTNTNEQVGCLGLGSKSPFAYTDAFSVTTWDGEAKRSYLCALGLNGIPSITALGSEPSQDPRGLEVSFPCQAQHHDEFAQEARHVAQGFDVPPSIAGEPIEVPVPVYSGDGWRVFDNRDNAIRQGCVIYPVTRGQLVLNTAFRGSHGLVIDVPIGTVEVAANREALSFDDHTKEVVQDIFVKAYDELETQVARDIVEAPTLLEAEKAFVASKFLTLKGVKWGPETHPIPLTGRVTFSPKHVDTLFTQKSGESKYRFNSYHVVEIEKLQFLVTYTKQKVSNRQQRIREFKDTLNWVQKSFLYTINNPTPSQLRRLVRRLGLRPDQVIGVASLPEIARPTPTISSGTTAPVVKYSGAWSYPGHGDELTEVDELPDEYLWVPITNPRHNNVSLGEFGSAWWRGEAFRDVRHIATELGIETPVIYLTGKAHERANPTPETNFFSMARAAIDAQLPVILRKATLARTAELCRSERESHRANIEPLFEDEFGDLEPEYPHDRIKIVIDPEAWTAALVEGKILSDKIQNQYPLLFTYKINDETIRDYVALRKAAAE